jgi:hypothetical protein
MRVAATITVASATRPAEVLRMGENSPADGLFLDASAVGTDNPLNSLGDLHTTDPLVGLRVSLNIASRNMAEGLSRWSGFAATAGIPLLVIAPTASCTRTRERLVEKMARSLRSLAKPELTLAIENGGPFPGSFDLWQVVDSAACPEVQASLNLRTMSPRHETLSIALPRLGRKLALLSLPAITIDPQGVSTLTSPFPKQSLDSLVNILRGLAYCGWIVVGPATTAGPGEDTAREIRAVRTEIDRPVVELAAYKGDPTAPRFKAPSSLACEAAAAQVD